MTIRTKICIFLFSISLSVNGYGQDVKWYNTDSLLTELSKNEEINNILNEAETIYAHAGIKPENISLTAFKVGYLEKRMVDERMIHIRHRHRYKNKKILSIADYTRGGNMARFATIDLVRRKLLHDTLLSQGAGKGDRKNDKYRIPVFFSNTNNSEAGSLGLIVTRKARQPENPCHYCKYALQVRHKCTIILIGLEDGINDNIRKRDIVIHTTGSASVERNRKMRVCVKDANYKVATSECRCYRTNDEDKVKGIGAYASACGIAENKGYMGQSNGCLVLPEDDHITIMETIRRKSLIFIYSNVIYDGTDYFGDSPIMLKIIKYAAQRYRK